jgi:hypothetical protein
MKTRKHRPIVVGFADISREREVQREIETFVNALNSYPEHFARDPYVSFEQHLFSVVVADQNTAESSDCHRESSPE